MITKDELSEIGQEAFKDLGLKKWSVWFTDVEAEELQNRKPKPGTALYLEYKLVDGEGGFKTIYLRLEDKNNKDKDHRNKWIKEALKSHIRLLSSV